MKKLVLILLVAVTLSSTCFAETQSTITNNFSPQMTQSGKVVNKNGIWKYQVPSLPRTFRVMDSISNNDPNVFTRSNASTGWKDYTIISTSTIAYAKELGNHPDFNSKLSKYADSIILSASESGSFSASVGINIGYVGVYVGYSPAASAGRVFNNPWKNESDSTVVVMGDVIEYKYKVKQYTGAGQLISTTTESRYQTNNTYPGFKVGSTIRNPR